MKTKYKIWSNKGTVKDPYIDNMEYDNIVSQVVEADDDVHVLELLGLFPDAFKITKVVKVWDLEKHGKEIKTKPCAYGTYFRSLESKTKNGITIATRYISKKEFEAIKKAEG